MTIEKIISLTRRTFVGKVISLLFNMLSRFVITFLPESNSKRLSCRLSGTWWGVVQEGSRKRKIAKQLVTCKGQHFNLYGKSFSTLATYFQSIYGLWAMVSVL